jgi:hypothetical protein
MVGDPDDADDPDVLELEYNPGWGAPVFSDQFGGTALKATWKQEGALPIGQCYNIVDGELVLKPAKRTDCYIFNDTVFDGSAPGTAFMFAAKVKISQSNGNHPSFWLHGPRSQALYNEYDIVESYGTIQGDPDRPCASGTVTSTSGKGWYSVQSNHYSGVGPTTGRRDCFDRGEAAAALDGGYHVFSMMWAPGKVVEFYLDGKRTARWGAKHAIGGSLVIALTNLLNEIKDAQGNITGYKDVTGNAPNMRLKWVKVWKKTGVTDADFRVTTPTPTSRAVVDPAFYLASYPDLQAAFGTDQAAALQHWQTYGIAEGRVGSPTFDLNHYRAVNADLQGMSNAELVNHFVTYGIYEGRETSPYFNVGQYLASYADLAAAFADTPEDAFDHFVNLGIGEGRVASAHFNAPWYLQSNPDVAAAYGATNYLGAMAHYQGWGRVEGRPGTP